MNKSDTIGALAAALAKAQGQMTFASKDALNPHFKSKYADLAAVIDAVRKPLTDNGLSFTQVCDFTDDKGLVIETVLMHASGEWISGRMYMPCPQMTPQGIGSATSYGKRYSLAAIVGIAADDDDDGEAAMGRGEKPEQKPPRQQKAAENRQQSQQGQSQNPPKEMATQDQLAKISDLILALHNRDGGSEADILKTISLFPGTNGDIWLTPDTLEKKCTKGYAGKIIGKAEEMLKS